MPLQAFGPERLYTRRRFWRLTFQGSLSGVGQWLLASVFGRRVAMAPQSLRSSVRRSKASTGRFGPELYPGSLLIYSLLDLIKPIGQLVPVS